MMSVLVGSRRLALLVGCAVAALAFAAWSASATAAPLTFTVNNVGDQADAQPGNGKCDSNASLAGDQCSLRAAVGESNANTGADTVQFSIDAVWHKTIAIAAPLEIKDTIALKGCGPNDATGQCVAIDAGDASIDAIDIDPITAPDNVVVSGLRIINARRGIYQPHNQNGEWSEHLLVQSNVFDNVNKGLELDGGSPQIGGKQDGRGNKFISSAGTNSAAIELRGWDNVVEGNDIGAQEISWEPPERSFTDGIRAFGSSTIGGVPSYVSNAPHDCDEACNEIVNATDAGIDLDPQGQGPDNHVFVWGNFIGTGYPGIHRGNDIGVKIGTATGFQIGWYGNDLYPKGAPNVISGNRIGIQQRGPGGDTWEIIARNLIGFQWGGLEPNTEAGLDVDRVDAIVANEIVGDGSSDSVGMTLRGLGSDVAENSIGFSSASGDAGLGVGMRILGDGNWLEDNQIGNSTGNGVEILGGDGNVLLGNSIGAPRLSSVQAGNGGAGVLIDDDGADPANGNVIGPYIDSYDDPDAGTVISNNEGPGIAVLGHGFNNRFEYFGRSVRNGGPFIDLGNDGPGNTSVGPNGGTQEPLITGAWGGSTEGNIVQGLARPNANISIYSAGPNNGGIGTLVATATADGTGHFDLDLEDPAGEFAVGDRVVATQTTGAGTSELSAPRTVLYGSPAFGPNGKPTKVPPSTAGSGDAQSKLLLAAASLRLRGSTIRLPLECHSAKTCRGTVAIRSAAPVAAKTGHRSKAGRKVLRIGTASFSLAPGATAVVTLSPSAKISKLLRRLGNVRVKVFLTQPSSDDAIYALKLRTK